VAGHAHLGQDLADSSQDTAHLAIAEPPDAADAEAVRDGQLARIDDVAASSGRAPKALIASTRSLR